MLRSTRFEKVFYGLSLVVFLLALTHLAWLFYDQNSVLIPSDGGTYTEGAVGTVNFINPVLARSNSVEHDITNLIYSGLTKYDPISGAIVPDLATYTVDSTHKKYTFKLNDQALWHDGKKVTADDVIFTYKDVMQHADFVDPILAASFKDVLIEKVDESTILFSLKEPYFFFPSATAIGILPKHIWQDVPVRNLDKSEVNLAPVGSGPYQFVKLTNPTGSQKNITTVDLQLFPKYYGAKSKITNIAFKLFASIEDLVANLSLLDAVNNVPNEELVRFLQDKRLRVFSYNLPQYVAMFLNMSSPLLENKNVRLAMLLGTNKDELLKIITNVQRVDTPFLELKNSTWMYQYNLEKARGALFDAGWKLKSNSGNGNVNAPVNGNNNGTASLSPALYASTGLLAVTYQITEPNNGVSFTTRTKDFVLRGTNPKTAKQLLINNYPLKKFTPSKGTWSYIADADLGTLKKGKNVFNVYYVSEDDKKVFLDSMTITYDPNWTPGTPEPVENENANTSALPVATNQNINSAVVPPTANSNQNTPVPVSANVNSANTNAALPASNSNANLSLNQNQNSTVVNLNVNGPANENSNAFVITPEIEKMLRYNSEGKPLILRLVTTENPADFLQVAEYLRQEWLKIGILLRIEPLPNEEILDRIQSKEYDILLYGQSLEYNLDTFPYWHSSQAATGLNLSNFKNFQADALIEEIRNPFLNKTNNTNDPKQIEKSRTEALQKLVKVFEDNIPAIFLYQPIYHYAVDKEKIKNLEIKNLSTFADRFSLMHQWYIVEKKILKQSFSFTWLQQWLTEGWQK